MFNTYSDYLRTNGGINVRTRNEAVYQQKKTEIMEKCFACYAEYGFSSVGVKALAKACGYTPANLYTYFEDLDDLVIQSTEHCMTKVEDDFMALAPTTPEEVLRYIEEVPYWTAEKHGKMYRLMYQIYTHPKYTEYGKKFYDGVNERYTQYARQLSRSVGIPYDMLVPMIFILVRASVHYALFGDEYYLRKQLDLLKWGVKQCIEQPQNEKQA